MMLVDEFVDRGRFWDTKWAGELSRGVLGLILRNFHDENIGDVVNTPPSSPLLSNSNQVPPLALTLV